MCLDVMSHRSEPFVDVVGTVVRVESLECGFDFLWSSTGRVTRRERRSACSHEYDRHPPMRIVHQQTMGMFSERMRDFTSGALRFERQQFPSANERILH